MPASYPNAKVAALIDGHISISNFTERDYLDLAMAALDQGGMSAADQARVVAMLPAPECCLHPDCEEDAGHKGRHTFHCDDGSCCEPRELDAEYVAELRERHFGEGF